tara:strand:- start:392 stop:565 length:174 start_codon:yes stop_codon:yes gene_type:complete
LALRDYIQRPRKEWTEKEWIQEAQIMVHSPWISEDDRNYWKDTLKNLRTKGKTIKEG